jgi:hypothetical protein
MHVPFLLLQSSTRYTPVPLLPSHSPQQPLAMQNSLEGIAAFTRPIFADVLRAPLRRSPGHRPAQQRTGRYYHDRRAERSHQANGAVHTCIDRIGRSAYPSRPPGSPSNFPPTTASCAGSALRARPYRSAAPCSREKLAIRLQTTLLTDRICRVSRKCALLGVACPYIRPRGPLAF